MAGSQGGRGRARRTAAGGDLLACGDIEANPGPESVKQGGWHVLTANVTSLSTHIEEVKGWSGVDVVALQETRVGEQAQRHLEGELNAAGWDVFWGKPQKREKRGGDTPSIWASKHGGVAFLVRKGIPVRMHGGALWETGRVGHIEASYGDGNRSVHFFMVYAPVADEEGREEILQKVLEEVAGLGDVPAIILGDLNTEPDDSPVLTGALRTGRWTDAAVTWAGENPPEKTCFVRGTSEGSRIDMILMNQVAGAGLEGVEVWHDTAIPTHKPVGIRLGLAPFEVAQLKVRRPKALPMGEWPKFAEGEEDRMGRESIERHRGELDRACQSGDMDA
eukprot:Sspe_Gene.20034::Locus_7315_Transcript_1_1_Confidence_1.000_Length_2311::g.20034::m.20034